MSQKNNGQIETESLYRKINSQMMIGWMIIVVALLVTYSLEVVKKQIEWQYLLAFVPIVTIPFAIAAVVYFRNRYWKGLCYVIVPGYFIMYLFVMFTGRTTMVFSYILPLLLLLILYHHPKLILGTGIAALIVNLISIFINYRAGLLDITTSKNAEIQVALIVLSFGGCYFATRLYEKITEQNEEYQKTLNEKNDHIQTMSLQTLTTIAKMIDAKDTYTEGHSQRVSIYSTRIAQELGFSTEEVETIRKIALLHDIGKVGIPDLILNKPARLTEEEYITMKNHAAIGGDIIMAIKTLPGLYDGVRYHHERYDGKGYPDGLKGDEIPYIARIIAVADAYDAMTSNRVYRRQLDDEHVLSELERGIGTQFDPDIARTMIELMKSGAVKDIASTAAQPPARNRSTAVDTKNIS